MRRKENPEGKGRNGLRLFPEDTAPSQRRMGDVNRAGAGDKAWVRPALREGSDWLFPLRSAQTDSERRSLSRVVPREHWNPTSSP